MLAVVIIKLDILIPSSFGFSVYLLQHIYHHSFCIRLFYDISIFVLLTMSLCCCKVDICGAMTVLRSYHHCYCAIISNSLLIPIIQLFTECYTFYVSMCIYCVFKRHAVCLPCRVCVLSLIKHNTIMMAFHNTVALRSLFI